MTHEFVCSVCKDIFAQAPTHIQRFSTWLDNYVFHVKFETSDCVFRCGTHSYENTLHYLTELHTLGIPVPQVLAHGQQQDLFYMITCYLQGQELGDIYPFLSSREKQTIAKEVVAIQNRVATLQMDSSNNWEQ